MNSTGPAGALAGQRRLRSAFGDALIYRKSDMRTNG
jgi:hypothetical protein